MPGKAEGLQAKNVQILADFFDATDTQELEWEDTDVEFQRPELVHVGIRHAAYIKRMLRKAVRR